MRPLLGVRWWCLAKEVMAGKSGEGCHGERYDSNTCDGGEIPLTPALLFPGDASLFRRCDVRLQRVERGAGLRVGLNEPLQLGFHLIVRCARVGRDEGLQKPEQGRSQDSDQGTHGCLRISDLRFEISNYRG